MFGLCGAGINGQNSPLDDHPEQPENGAQPSVASSVASVEDGLLRIGLIHKCAVGAHASAETKPNLLEVLGEYGMLKYNYERSAKVWPHLSELVEEG